MGKVILVPKCNVRQNYASGTVNQKQQKCNESSFFSEIMVPSGGKVMVRGT